MATSVRTPRHWTLDDLHLLPDDGQRYELVDGGLAVTPPPTQDHQSLAGALRDLLAADAPTGWRCRVEFPLPLATDTLRIPDVVVHRWPPRQPRSDAQNPVGPDDVGLVAEVVSPSSRRTDRFAKPGDYAEAGIGVLWRLETEPSLRLHALVLRGGAYVEVAVLHEAGRAPTPWGEVAVDPGALRA